MKINMNKMAKDISEIEGKKVEVNIAQIKEVLSIAMHKLSEYDDDEILMLVHRYQDDYIDSFLPNEKNK